MKKKSCIVIFISIIFTIICCFIGYISCVNLKKELKPKQIFQRNLRSVVELKASSQDIGDSFGTAEFVDNEGTLITNAHIITYKKLGVMVKFEKYSIRFADEEEYRMVELVEYDENLDIAILQLKDKNCKFTPVTFGDSSKIESGDKVYAIGNSVNYGLSISQGIVGIPLLKVEYLENVREVIQCDLTIVEGNSGGVLFDETGKMIGVTTFRLKDNRGNVIQGIAYCIPIDVVIEYLNTNF